jgi:hypothetical protein
MPRGLFILASDLPAWRNALEKVAMKKAANRPPQGTPRHGGNGREAFLAKLRCLMRAVQSYPFRKPALQVLSDRSPANAAFVAWYASRSRSIVGRRQRHRENFSGRIGFRCSERKAPERLSPEPGARALSFWVMNHFRPKPTISHIAIAVALMGAAVTIGIAIWHSQKGKSQGPAIIDKRHVSQGQR